MAYSASEHYRLAKQRPTLINALDECRRAYCLAALEMAGGNVSRAARESGIGRQHLTKLIKRFDLRVRRRMRGRWGILTD
jgi:transcriptional regulator of acetoin/glycerol metabolism